MHAAADERDEDIAIRVQGGDAQIFQVLVSRYDEKLKRYAKRFLFDMDDAQDLVQDVFVKVYIKIKTFDATRKFSPWLYRVAHNEFVNALKKKTDKKGTKIPLFGDDGEVAVPGLVAKETADGAMHREEIRLMFYHAIEQLRSIYKEPLVLYYFEEMDYKAIAEILDISVSTVGVRLQRGKAMLKRLVKHTV